jgi:hypothetical protein
MRKPEKASPTESSLLFEIDPEPAPELLTALGGMPLVVQAFRSLGLPGSIQRQVRIKQRQRGYDEATWVESFVVLHAAGGECLDDFQRLREDSGLPELIGHELPSPSAALQFLYQFHEGEKIAEAQQRRLPKEEAYIPEENEALQGLGRVNRDLVQVLGQRCPDQKIATVDLDATIIESRKREALPTYEGECGYQPMLAVWAETDVVLADEFRDGNVPAMMDLQPVARRAFGALPGTIETFYFRGDAACHEHRLINWLRDEEREGGPRGFIGFAISARMTEALRAAIRALPEEAWQMEKSEVEAERHCAEVPFVPSERSEKKDLQPLRYVAVRVRKRQGELFADGSRVKYFAVVSNLAAWSTPRLLEWHRQKAGSIERVHDILKNDLGAGVMPCGRFGANAAWLRLNVLTHNVLTSLKRLALPPELLAARPKRLRFLIFHTPGRIVQHARRVLLRLAATPERIAEWIAALQMLPVPVG